MVFACGLGSPPLSKIDADRSRGAPRSNIPRSEGVRVRPREARFALERISGFAGVTCARHHHRPCCIAQSGRRCNILAHGKPGDWFNNRPCAHWLNKREPRAGQHRFHVQTATGIQIDSDRARVAGPRPRRELRGVPASPIVAHGVVGEHTARASPGVPAPRSSPRGKSQRNCSVHRGRTRRRHDDAHETRPAPPLETKEIWRRVKWLPRARPIALATLGSPAPAPALRPRHALGWPLAGPPLDSARGAEET